MKAKADYIIDIQIPNNYKSEGTQVMSQNHDDEELFSLAEFTGIDTDPSETRVHPLVSAEGRIDPKQLRSWQTSTAPLKLPQKGKERLEGGNVFISLISLKFITF